MSKLRIQRVN